MNRMRLRIAERLKQSQNTAASLTTFNEVDMTAIMEFRKRHKDDILKQHNVKLGFMSAFAKASILAMKDLPVVNASIEGPNGGDTIVYRDYVDVSVAVSTPKGLVTPVLRNAESMNMVEIEQGIAELGKKVSLALLCHRAILIYAGTRRQALYRRYGWRQLYHFKWWRLRLHDGYPNHQPSANCCARSTRNQGETCHHQRQDREQTHDVPCFDVRSQNLGWQGSSDFLGSAEEVYGRSSEHAISIIIWWSPDVYCYAVLFCGGIVVVHKKLRVIMLLELVYFCVKHVCSLY